MTRLQKYILNESYKTIFKDMYNMGTCNMDSAIEIIQRDCKPYLNLIKSTGNLKAACRYYNSSYFFIKCNVRSDRRPTDTDLETHEKFDELFYKKFKWRVRSNGIFTWVRRSYNKITLSLFFPIGKFDYIWSPIVKDLYIDYTCTTMEHYTKEEIVDSYKLNKDIGNVTNQEVVWKCKSYYLLRGDPPVGDNNRIIFSKIIRTL